MEHMKEIDKLAETARGDSAPPVNVTGEVMQRIRQERDKSGMLPLRLGWFAVASAAAAGVAAVLTYQAWSGLLDPMGSLFNPLFLVIQ
jgi:anti-sigma factor RsiW